MYESLNISEYVKKMQEQDCQNEIKIQKIIKECWEDGEPMGRFKTQKPTKKLMEALE